MNWWCSGIMAGITAFLLASGIVISPVPPSDPSVPRVQIGHGGVYISVERPATFAERFWPEPLPSPPLLRN